MKREAKRLINCLRGGRERNEIEKNKKNNFKIFIFFSCLGVFNRGNEKSIFLFESLKWEGMKIWNECFLSLISFPSFLFLQNLKFSFFFSQN